jgi:transcriptional regulator with XRE-family HTH domain
MTSAISIAFGGVLRQHREQAALSQEALAHESEVHRTYVSLIERGIRHPTLDVVFRLASALDIPPATLVGETEVRLKRRRK